MARDPANRSASSARVPSLQTVAERIGHSSEYAFAKAFKREYGIAPGRYRRQRQPSKTHAEP